MDLAGIPTGKVRLKCQVFNTKKGFCNNFIFLPENSEVRYVLHPMGNSEVVYQSREYFTRKQYWTIMK